MEVTELDPWYLDEEWYDFTFEETMKRLSVKGGDLFDLLLGESYLHYLVHQHYSFSIPPYFMRDHPDDDDWFLEELSNVEIPVKRRPNYINSSAVETLVKEVVLELLWHDFQRVKYFWNPDRWEMHDWGIEITETDIQNIFTSISESLVLLIYFLYPQPDLFKIGHTRSIDNQSDKLWDKLVDFWKEKEPSFDQVCLFVTRLISEDKDEYNLLTEEEIADIIFRYPRFTGPRFQLDSDPPSFPIATEKDKQHKIFKDFAKFVQDLNPPPFNPHEHTHWMMRFLRGDYCDVDINLYRKIIDGREKLPMQVRFTQGEFYFSILPIFSGLSTPARNRMNSRLGLTILPLVKIFDPKSHEMSRVIVEIVQVAELRRTALGVRFIGRSHLIWAFYKLGYALPLNIRAEIKLDDADEDHPPYHIYMAARILSLLSWDRVTNLVHFIFAVIHSKQIGIDGQGVIQLFENFKNFMEGLETTENEIEPKHTVTVRSCPAFDAVNEMAEIYYPKWTYMPDSKSSEDSENTNSH